jgi:hypothetical protein
MVDNEQHTNAPEGDGDAATAADEPTVVHEAESPGRPAWRDRLRDRRTGWIAAGVGLFLLAGLGGFGIGQATAGDEGHERGRFGPGHHGEMRGDGPGGMRDEGRGEMSEHGPSGQAPEAPGR